MKKIFISASLFVTSFLPLLVMAQEPKLDGYLTSLIKQGSGVLSSLLVFLIGLAVVWFIWNVIKYSMSGEEDDKEKARSQMINGIIAIAVIVSVWGIVGLLRTAFGTTGGSADQNLGNMIPGVSSGSSLPRIPDGTEWEDYSIINENRRR